MIYLFYGSDVEKVRTKAFEWVAKARAKEPNLAYVRLTQDELSDNALIHAASSGGLFVSRLLVLIDNPWAAAGKGEEEETPSPASSVLEEHFGALADSNNAIVILAPKLTAAKAKKFAGKAAKSYEYDAPVARGGSVAKQGFNTGLVNALAARSREKLWLEVVRALHAGDAPEQLHGLLHWKARDLMQKGARAWSYEDARALSRTLIMLLQDSRRTGTDLAAALERFALSV
jgi:DNA polymerase III delta subunit